ncbi:MAG: polysaccharide pyruvyl transferase family protein [Clostridiales bacterium]|nr:polysaccharide pyruvyl transferase family protein [Clostridiales bacterium]
MGKTIFRIKLYYRIIRKGLQCVYERLAHPGAVYLVLTPEHDNLGDHAIAKAAHKLLTSAGIKVIEVTAKELQRRRELGLLRLMNGRKILVNGGGNLGTLWFPVEELFRALITKNQRSAIFVLPNTVYYEASEFGEREKRRSVELYNAHNKLTLYLREKKSFQMASELYKNARVKLMPDMVLLLNYSESHVTRNGCLLTLRRDIERTLSSEQEEIVGNQAGALFGDNVAYLDMVMDHAIPVSQRDMELSKQFEAFKHAELVITDRLHGMIFAAITGTPCIVIESKSHKLRGSYEWIKDLDYIRFCDNVEDITAVYSSMPKGEFTYDNSRLLEYYRNLVEDISKKE